MFDPYIEIYWLTSLIGHWFFNAVNPPSSTLLRYTDCRPEDFVAEKIHTFRMEKVVIMRMKFSLFSGFIQFVSESPTFAHR